MKVLKWILIVLVALVAIFLIYSASQPNKVVVEESITINAPASKIYDEVINFPNWTNWSVWSQMDPNMEQEFSDEMGKVGSYNSWKSENPMVGVGRQDVVEIRENEYMKVDMRFQGMEEVPAYAEFILEPAEDGTLVRWTFEGAETPFYLNWMNGIIKKMLIDNYNKSLANLKEYVEAMPTAEMPKNVSLIDFEGQAIISILDSTNAEGIPAKLTELYTELSIFAETHDAIKVTGMPLAIYHEYSPEKVVMEAAMPISGTAENKGRVKVGELAAGKALKGVHFGDYIATEDLHYAISDYATAAGWEMIGSPWEVYANDPALVDSAEVETHIYYPVSK